MNDKKINFYITAITIESHFPMFVRSLQLNSNERTLNNAGFSKQKRKLQNTLKSNKQKKLN